MSFVGLDALELSPAVQSRSMRPGLVFVAVLLVLVGSLSSWTYFLRSQAKWEATLFTYRIHLLASLMCSTGVTASLFCALHTRDYEPLDPTANFVDEEDLVTARSLQW